MNDEPLIDTRTPKLKTLRDEFAMAALPAEIQRWKEGHPSGFEGIAYGCYMIADAMIRARAK